MTKAKPQTHSQNQNQNTQSNKGYKPIWIIISFALLIGILLLPTPSGLPIMAKAVSNISICCDYVVTEVVSYPVSHTHIGFNYFITGI